MTDKQLEEYTRLKIQEATKELQEKYDRLNSASKEYQSIYYSGGVGFDIMYYDKDDLTKELKEKHEDIKNLMGDLSEIKAKLKSFNDSPLIERIKIAIRGEL